MPLRASILLLLPTLSATVSPVLALKLTNRDPIEQKLTITENSAIREQTLKPTETVDNFCVGGCTIQIQNGEEYEFDGNEVVSIEEGLLYLDEPAQGSADMQKQ